MGYSDNVQWIKINSKQDYRSYQIVNSNVKKSSGYWILKFQSHRGNWDSLVLLEDHKNIPKTLTLKLTTGMNMFLKLLENIICIPLYLLLLLVPKNPNIWVFRHVLGIVIAISPVIFLSMCKNMNRI